jgi:hypothetical protein
MSSTMTKIEIHFKAGEAQYVPALDIPVCDITTLSLEPLKWLRFVSFAITGAEGDLSASPGGPVVDYESSTLLLNYFFTPTGDSSHSST